jgi:hypothetical protein
MVKHICAAQVCTLFIDFQSLRELRITSVIIQVNCNRPKEMWVGFKCNGLIVFFQRGGASKVYNTCVSRLPPPHPPPPPRLPHLLSLAPSPLFPHPPAPLLLGDETSLALVLWQGCSLKRRSIMTVPLTYLMDQSRWKIQPERRSQEMTSSDPAPSPGSLGVPD